MKPIHKSLNHTKNVHPEVLTTMFVSFCSSVSMDVWHRRLHHPHFTIVKSVLQFFKHPSTHINKLNFCDVCALCKHHSLPFLRLNTIYSAPLQLVVFDLWGLAHNLFRNDFKYYIRFMDVYHRYTLIYFLQSKFDAFSTF